MTSLFTRQGDDTFVATEHSRGPWSPDALHGGPVAALLVGAAEALLAPLRAVRLTLDLERPVPVGEPVTVRAEITRPGRKARAARAELHGERGLLAVASVLAIRVEDVAVPAQDRPAPPPGPEEGRELGRIPGSLPAFHSHGVDHRFVTGHFTEDGPSTDWIRLTGPVVEGEPTTPFQRVAAAADFGNGISRLAEFTELGVINPDLTVSLVRLPVGEWIGLEASSDLGPDGIGVAESRLWDLTGPIGRSMQSLVVDRR